MATRSTPSRLALPTAAALAGLLAAPPAAAEEAYGDLFNGSFVEYGVRGGRSGVAEPALGGWTLDAGLRQSFPMLLGDTRLAYRYDSLGTLEGLGGEVTQHGVGVSVGLHPAYILILGSDWLSYVASSFYLELGVGGQYVVLDRGADGTEGDLGATWSLGSGIDIPLSDPDRGWAPWINVLYRYHRGDLDLDDGDEVDLYLHTVFVGLSLRINGLLF